MQINNDDNRDRREDDDEEIKDTGREKQISSFCFAKKRYTSVGLGRTKIFLFCLQAISAMLLNFNPKLIPLFDDKDSDLSVQEWIKKVELICQLSGIKCIEWVVPMCFFGDAYAIYQQLSEDKRRDLACIKSALYMAFALDSVSAEKEFMTCKLRPEETVDKYLAELWRLWFGRMLEKGLTCAFIAGMPKSVEELLWPSSQVDNMVFSEVLARTWTILKTGPMTGTSSGCTTIAVSDEGDRLINNLQ